MTQPFIPEDRFCANPRCLIGRWSVTLHSAVNQVWRVISTYDNEPFLIAAPRPLCPCCGEHLLTHLEFEGGFGDGDQQEQGPLFDFVRHLR